MSLPRPGPPGPARPPEISVIVPTRDRAAWLGRALSAVAAAAFAPDRYEVIVVDNGSSDDTRAVTGRAVAAHPAVRIRYVLESEPGLLAGRHRGALEARGGILSFIDDDVEVSPGWLAAVSAAFTDPAVHLVGGPSLPRWESPPEAWVERLWAREGERRWCGHLSLLEWGDRVRAVDPTWIWGLNFSIRKETLVALGGFHPDCIPKALQRFQGDGETGLALKLRERRLTAIYHPLALVHHAIPAARLTRESLRQREFYQGVCDSYTRIRATGRVAALPFGWKEPLRLARLLARGLLDGRGSLPLRLRAAYLSGYAFHHREVRRDSGLLAWVLREDYWDYRLPAAGKEPPRQG